MHSAFCLCEGRKRADGVRRAGRIGHERRGKGGGQCGRISECRRCGSKYGKRKEKAGQREKKEITGVKTER